LRTSRFDPLLSSLKPGPRFFILLSLPIRTVRRVYSKGRVLQMVSQVLVSPPQWLRPRSPPSISRLLFSLPVIFFPRTGTAQSCRLLSVLTPPQLPSGCITLFPKPRRGERGVGSFPFPPVWQEMYDCPLRFFLLFFY